MVYSGFFIIFLIYRCVVSFLCNHCCASALHLRTVFAVLLIKSEGANPTFPPYFPDETTDNSAVSVLTSSGNLQSGSSKAPNSIWQALFWSPGSTP